MDRAVRLPGLRALDRNFDRLPESLRWLVERVVHDPDPGAAPKPKLAPELRARLEASAARRRRRARADRRAQLRLARGLKSLSAQERAESSAAASAARPSLSTGSPCETSTRSIGHSSRGRRS